MNDKDKEAFEKWLGNNTTTQEEIEAYEAMSEKDRVMFCMKYTWQAACEYKETENKKLREALTMIKDYGYATCNGDGEQIYNIAEEALKEMEHYDFNN
jgi:hypothetical protein